MRDAWARDPPAVLNRVWLSLQAGVLARNLIAGGDNDYKLAHLHKGKRERAGTLPWQLECEDKAWTKDNSALRELEQIAREAAAGRGR